MQGQVQPTVEAGASTLNTYVGHWLETLRPRLGARTIKNYGDQFRFRWHRLGDVPLRDLQAPQIEG